ncbi:glycosyl hydrolase family 28-related protein [Pontiella sp.]|uniref:glycosyl hydrolase family 28-related protein n=1 Tax=Pontiella sp. TaxID=2837462 RepID=UPI003561ECDB
MELKNLPDMPTSGPGEEVLRDDFAPFSPPVALEKSADANAPQIAEWIRQNQPGDTLVLTAEGLDADDTAFIAYGEASGLVACDAQLIDGRQAAVTLSDALRPAADVYLLWAMNGSGFGEPVAINAAQADWVGFDSINPGETFYVYGKNLTLDGVNAYCYVKELDEWLTSTECNPYKAAFKMPESAATQSYTLYAHNGHGGKYGFADALTVEVVSPYVWTGKIIDVTAYGANGSDGNDDYAAILSAYAAASAGDTLYFPAGEYIVSELLTVSKNLQLVGDGTNSVVRNLPGESWGNILFLKTGYCTVKNLMLDAYSTGNIITTHQTSTRMEFENVTFSGGNIDPLDGNASVSLDKTGYMRFTNCTFNISGSIQLKATLGQVRFEDCRILGMHDAVGLVASTTDHYDFSDCVVGNLDATDASSSYGWARGRWIVQNQGNYVYIGGNVVSNMAPRIPIPFFSGGITSYSELGESTNVYTLGTCKSCTFQFDDIPDEFDGRGDDSVDWSGAIIAVPYGDGTGSFDAWVKKNNAIQNYVTVWIKQTSWDEAEQMNQSVTTSATLIDKTDQNSGEQILCEGLQTWQAGYVLSATPTNLFISVAEASESAQVDDANQIFITGGRGLGQCRRASVNAATGEVTIEGIWRVVPDSSSTYELVNGANSFVVYNNYFSARETGLGYSHKATTALQMSAGHGFVFANNRLEKMRHIVRLFGHDGENSALDGVSAPAPNYFGILSGNEVYGTACGFDNIVVSSGSDPLVDGDAFNLGNVFRDNIVSNITYRSAFSFTDSFSVDSTFGVNVLDGNQVSGFGAVHVNDVPSWSLVRAVPLRLDSKATEQVLVGNVFSGHASITGLSATNVVLQGNTWSNFGETYAAKYGRLAVKRPVSIDGSVEIWNTGTSELAWTSLTLGGGTIAPEDRIRIDDVDEGIHTIQADGQARQVEVAQLIQTAGTNMLTLTLSGYDGVWVKIKVLDLISDVFLEHGPWYEPTQLSFEVPTRYTLEIMTSNTETGVYRVKRSIVDPPAIQ